MAKGKRRKTTKKQNSRSRKNTVDIDLAVVFMIILSILLAVLIYTSSGYIGKTLSPLLGGIMGWMKYILPIGTFAIGINLAFEKRENLSRKTYSICNILSMYCSNNVYISNICGKYRY